MGCGCGKTRMAQGGITSAQTGQMMSPQEAAANAIANAKGEAYTQEDSAPVSGGKAKS